MSVPPSMPPQLILRSTPSRRCPEKSRFRFKTSSSRRIDRFTCQITFLSAIVVPAFPSELAPVAPLIHVVR